MFKLPSIGISNKHEPLFAGIPRFRYHDLKGKEEIGSGGFGKVLKCCHSNETVAVKVSHEEDDYSMRNMAKEARLLHGLRSPHIANFRLVCLDPPSIMLDFECFSFRPFGIDREFYNLKEYLNFLNKLDDASFFFEFLPNTLDDIVQGLGYLHGKGVAHRDLKPHNILVSNQNYAHVRADDPGFARVFKDRPITCKLTDFGESRSDLIQTRTLANANTRTVERGTNPYLAPEAIVPSLMLKSATSADLFKIDIWALGMTIFGILNPGLPFPFREEFEALPKAKDVRADPTEQFKQHIINKLEKGQRPSPSMKYANLQNTDWSSIRKIYRMCTLQSPAARPLVQDIIQMVQNTR
ncbi:cyclin-dependent kinase 2 homolog [Lineus longissimus]|uniref:cyclin-dependent kinase 2 homolog n=1 Tax=Lineus longissimus TaxID=88925 RepID=UPI00315DB9BB